MSILTIILSILLPPVAVFMKRGLGGAFLLNILLTLIGWLPGVIHALIVNDN
ncbi:YqaE/Pmp3 family membrane protein [Lacinutrix sp. Hel_I_90]|uniref:YqaE/Pmp3 family membrane protein n=1 Tax=Lacinutrix sp. Hel_I_90 TaxID=1249999 RepID=UPI0009E59097|nr:YqaE/Pmp3 family membrane protein [Lacinutrix sp. Hel_I_90]